MGDAMRVELRGAGRGVVVREAGLGEILALRHAELRPGLPLSSAQFAGDEDAATRHFGAFDAATGETLGCASFMAAPLEGEPAMQLRGMATRRDLVRCGIGAALLGHACRTLAAGGTRLLWCNARVTAAPFYARLGWAIVSEAFDIPGVGPHHQMTLRIGSTPVL